MTRILPWVLSMAVMQGAMASPPQTTDDGLVLTQAKGVDVLYRRPDASLADNVFAKVLSDGGYPVVTTPDAGVLQVVPAIVDLYVNAPDAGQQAARTRTFVLSAGSMRLTFELRDAVTGVVLFRGSDLKRDPEMRPLQWSSGAFNRAKAETALAGWATQLKQALDAAKTASETTASN